MKVKGNHPLAEVIARSLFGIEDPRYSLDIKQRMVNRTCKNAVEWHNAFLDVHKIASIIRQCGHNISKVNSYTISQAIKQWWEEK